MFVLMRIGQLCCGKKTFPWKVDRGRCTISDILEKDDLYKEETGEHWKVRRRGILSGGMGRGGSSNVGNYNDQVDPQQAESSKFTVELGCVSK